MSAVDVDLDHLSEEVLLIGDLLCIKLLSFITSESEKRRENGLSGFPPALGSYPEGQSHPAQYSSNKFSLSLDRTDWVIIIGKYRSCDPYNNLSLISRCQNFGARQRTH